MEWEPEEAGNQQADHKAGLTLSGTKLGKGEWDTAVHFQPS